MRTLILTTAVAMLCGCKLTGIDLDDVTLPPEWNLPGVPDTPSEEPSTNSVVDPVPVEPSAPAVEVCKLRAWERNASIRYMNDGAHSISRAEHRRRAETARARGETERWTYLYNWGDGPGITSFYKDDVFAGEVDERKLAALRAKIEDGMALGFQYMFWLLPDDNKRHIRYKDLDLVERHMRICYERMGDLGPVRWVLCLEGDEQWRLSRTIRELVRRWKVISPDPIGLHYTDSKRYAKYAARTGADFLVSQDPRGKSVDFYVKRAKETMDILGPDMGFILGEYDHYGTRGIGPKVWKRLILSYPQLRGWGSG